MVTRRSFCRLNLKNNKCLLGEAGNAVANVQFKHTKDTLGRRHEAKPDHTLLPAPKPHQELHHELLVSSPGNGYGVTYVFATSNATLFVLVF